MFGRIGKAKHEITLTLITRDNRRQRLVIQDHGRSFVMPEGNYNRIVVENVRRLDRTPPAPEVTEE